MFSFYVDNNDHLKFSLYDDASHLHVSEIKTLVNAISFRENGGLQGIHVDQVSYLDSKT